VKSCRTRLVGKCCFPATSLLSHCANPGVRLGPVFGEASSQRLAKRDEELEWSDVLRDVQDLRHIEVQQDGKRYLLRPPLQGVCGKVLQAVGVAVPPPVRDVPSHGAKA